MIAELKRADGSDEQDGTKVCGYIVEQGPMKWLASISHLSSKVIIVG